jgi:glyoxylase-like metal-dependent hydrolase (beta-lactamase superfamily II)
MPEAQIYIHSRSARYLVDPTDLLASAKRALGPLFALHGDVDPAPAERILPAEDLRLDLGRGVALRAIYTPGHSKDHLSYFEESSRCLFTGDAVGVDIAASDYVGPVTPPPGVNLAAQRETFEKLRALEIETLLFSHFGPAAESPRQIIDRLHEQFEQFVALVHAGWSAGQIDHAAIIKQMLAGRRPASPQAELVTAGWIEMSINGLVVAFEREAKKERGE